MKKKTYTTTKNKEELFSSIKYVKDNYKKLQEEDKLLCVLRIADRDKIVVSAGRGASEWKMNFDVEGEITVERCSFFMKWAMIFILIACGLIFFFIEVVAEGEISIGRVLFLWGIILCLMAPVYYIHIVDPLKQVERFVIQYLGGQKKNVM